MKQCLVVCSSNRLIEHQTQTAIQALVLAGACFLEQRDTGDVALARNLALTKAIRVLEQSAYDVILMIDDDMVFNTDQVQFIIERVRETKKAASGCYVLGNGYMAAQQMKSGLWQTGLGFLAIHRQALFKLANEVPVFAANKEAKFPTIQFTTTGFTTDAMGTQYFEPEDFCLTRRLGGVELLPIPIGHVKKRVLLPDVTQLEAFCKGEKKS